MSRTSAQLQIEDLSLASAAECRAGALRGPIDGRQNVLERCFVLVVEHSASERAAVPTAGCQELEQFAGARAAPLEGSR